MCYDDGNSPKEIEFNQRRCRPYEDEKNYKGRPSLKVGDEVWTSKDGFMYHVRIKKIGSMMQRDVNSKTKIPTYNIEYIGHKGQKNGYKDEEDILEWDLFDERTMPAKDILYCVEWNDDMMKSITPAQKRAVKKTGLLSWPKKRVDELRDQVEQEEVETEEDSKPKVKKEQGSGDRPQPSGSSTKVSRRAKKPSEVKKEPVEIKKESVEIKQEEGLEPRGRAAKRKLEDGGAGSKKKPKNRK